MSNGLAFAVGDFVVRYGELRQGSSSGSAAAAGAAGQAGARGTVVEVEWSSGGGAGGEKDGKDVKDEEEKEGEDWEIAEVVIRRFWEDLGVKGARGFVRVPGLEMGEGEVRQWFEALRARA